MDAVSDARRITRSIVWWRSLALLILIATITTALALRLGPFKLMGGGAVIGVLRGQLPL